MGGGTKSKPVRYTSPTPSVRQQRLARPDIPYGGAPSRQAQRATSKRKAARRAQRKFAKVVRQAAGISSPLGEMERQSMRFAERYRDAVESLPESRDLLRESRARQDRSPSARLPRNDYIPKPEPDSGPLRTVERAYLDLAKPDAALVYGQRRRQAARAEKRSNRKTAAAHKSGKNLLDEALGKGAAIAGLSQGSVAAADLGKKIGDSDVKLSRVPGALWYGVTEGRDDDVNDPNAVQIAEGAIGGLVDSATHPKKAVEAMVDDIERRYGDYLTGRITTKEYREKVRREPRLSYIADAAGVVPLGGTATAAGIKVAARGAAKAALKYGAKGAAKKATRIADYLDPKVARPKLAPSTGRPVTQRTPITGGFRLTFQRELDRVRTRKTAQRAARTPEPDTAALAAVEKGAVQAATSVGRAYAKRRHGKPEYARWRHRLMSKNARHGGKVLRDVQRLIGREAMDDGSLAVAMMTGATTREGLRAEARNLLDMFKEGRKLKDGDSGKVYDNENISDMERLLAKTDAELPDPDALDQAVKLLHDNNEVLKKLDKRLDPGVRVHELEAARRLNNIDRGPPNRSDIDMDSPAFKAHTEARDYLDELAAEPGKGQMANRALISRARGLTDKQLRDEITLRNHAIARYNVEAKKTEVPEGVDQSNIDFDMLDDLAAGGGEPAIMIQGAKQQRDILRAELRAREAGRRYLGERQPTPIIHGTTAERAAKIREEGFEQGESGSSWGYLADSERTAQAEDYAARRAAAEGGEPEVMEAYSRATNPLDLRTPEGQAAFADMDMAAKSVPERNQTLREHGYDAIITKEGAISAPDARTVTTTKPLPVPYEESRYLETLRSDPSGAQNRPLDPITNRPPSPNEVRAAYIEKELQDRGVDTSNISYVHAEAKNEPERAAFAPGQGQYNSRDIQQTTYETLATGRMNLQMTKVLPEQIARNIKGAVAREIIAEIIDKWTPTHITTRTGTQLHTRGIAWQERKTVMDKAPEVMKDHVWWNPGKAGDALKLLDAADNPDAIADDFLEKWSEDWEASIDKDGSRGEEGEWFLLDRGRAEQMEQSIKFNSGLFNRMKRKVLKGLPSKLVLMASPSWAILQVVNNAELAGLAGMVNPWQYKNALKVMAEMKREFPDEYERLTASASQGVLEHEFERTRLGSAGDKLRNEHPVVGRPVAYFKDTWEKWNDAVERAPKAVRGAAYIAKEIGSFRFLFHGDAANNALFRRTFMLDEANRIKFNGLDNAMQQEAGAIGRIMRGFRGNQVTPKDLADLVNNPEALEHMARATNDLFGNYTDFTPSERHYLEGNMLFYGFMRFSLRFTLYTMPVQHPLMSALLLKLSALKNEEVRELLKTGPNDPVPFGAIGALYKIDGNKITGKLPTNRINPFLNPITSAIGGDAPPSQAFTSVSPLVLELIQQGFGTSAFTGKNWYLKGPRESERLTGPADPRSPAWGPNGWETRARIALNHLTQLATPGRIASQQAAGGRPVAETSLPWDPQPIRFRDEETRASIRDRARAEEARGTGERYLRGLTDPVYSAITGNWAPSYDREVAKYLLEQEKRYLRPPKRGPRKNKGGSLGSGSTGMGSGGKL